MRIRNETLKTGSLLASFHPEDRGRNASILFLVKGVDDVEPLQRLEEALRQEASTDFGWYTVADQLDLGAVDPSLDATRMARFEVEEFAELDTREIRALMEPALRQLRRCELVRFPSAARAVGSVPKDEDFIGREQEVAQIVQWVDERRHVLLVAPRRSGKTALLYRLKEALKERFLPVFVDAERFAAPEGLVAELWASAAGKTFTAALREVRARKWPVMLEEALQKLAGDRAKPLVLMLDELVMHLEQILDGDQGATTARDLLRTLRGTLGKIGGRVLIAGSFDLEEFARSRLGEELSTLVEGLHRFPLPPLDQAHLDMHLRRVLLGTGLVPQAGDMAWLSEHVDLAMPFPALKFLENVAMLAREKPLTPERLDTALDEFLGETNAFKPTLDRLDELAVKHPPEADALESVLSHLALDERGMHVSDVHDKLKGEGPGQSASLFTRLMDGFPLRQEDGKVRMASRLFRRFWLVRQGLSS